jgi:hypothetical protein
MQNPMQNALTGIQLAQSGRKAEALAYLREAVHREPANAEVWLWLAHVTPDVREYQNCVYQALHLSPNHVIARQMQAALMQSTGQFQMAPPTYQQPSGTFGQPQGPTPYQSSPGTYQTGQINPEVLKKVQHGQRRRWLWRRVLLIAAVGAILGIIAAVIAVLAIDYLPL